MGKEKVALGGFAAVVPEGVAIVVVGALAFFVGRAIARSWRKDRKVRKDLADLSQAERAEHAMRYQD